MLTRAAAHRPASAERPLVLASRGAPRHWMLDALLIVLVLAAALGLRLINLDRYSGLFDEGIRVEQLFLMTLGYRPFKDIFAAQGPLLLDALYPLYRLFSLFVNPPLVAVRLAPVCYSLLGLVGLYWLGRQLAGRLGGLLALLLLALSPLYLEGSRLALAEVPALAPAILALGCAQRYSAGGRGAWLLAAGLLLTLSLLMKPITLAAAPAVGLAALLRGRRGLRDLVLVTLAMLALSLVVIWAIGFREFQDQILAYRQASREAEGWSLRKNWQALTIGFSYEPAALLPLAALGGLTLLISRPRRALPAVAWALGGLLLLLAYSPLHGKHIVVAVPGVALLAGAGCARLHHLAQALAPARRSSLAALPLVLALVWYGASLAPLLDDAGALLRVTADTDVDPAFEQYNDAVATLQTLTAPDDFIVTDQPYLAFLAGRKVPPELVDTALARIRSRSLTGARARELAARYAPKVVLLWGDRLRSLGSFKEWVDQSYRVVKVYSRRGDTDRLLYLRNDADLAAARGALGAAYQGTPGATFAGQVRLVGARLDRTEIAAGQGATIGMLWEQLRRAPVDYKVLVNLRAADGTSVDDQEESLGGGAGGTSSWPPGYWVVQSSFVVARDIPPGEYSVAVALYDPKARATIPPDGGGQGGEIRIGNLTVR